MINEIGTLFKGVVGSLLEKFPKVKNFLSSTVEKTLNFLENNVGSIIEKLSSGLRNFSENMGILDKNESIYNFGRKYHEALDAGIRREEFLTYEDFNEKISEKNIKIPNPENEDERIGFEKIGHSLLKEEIDKKLGVNMPEILYVRFSQMGMNFDKGDFEKISNIVLEKSLTNEKIMAFDSNSLNYEDTKEVKSGLTEIVRIKYPEIPDEKIIEKYYNAQDSSDSILA